MLTCRFVLKYSGESTKGGVQKQAAAYNNHSCASYILDPQGTWDFDLTGEGS